MKTKLTNWERRAVTASLGEFMGIYAVTQIPLAIVEGIIAAIVWIRWQPIPGCTASVRG